MKENIKYFKNWYKIANPSKKLWLIMFLTVLGTCICSLVEPIFAAKVITNITDNNWMMTCVFLTIGFMFIVIRKMFWDANYRFHYKLIEHSYMALQHKIFDKIAKATDENFENNSKEKLINIIHSSVYDTSDFADLLATRLARFIRVIITIVAIFMISVPIAIAIIIIDIINYFILNHLDNNLAKSHKMKYEANDAQYIKFSEVIDSKHIARDLSIQEKIKDEYLKSCMGYIKAKKKDNIFYSYKDNYYHIFYQFVIFTLTLVLVFLLSKGNLTITLYFIIVPYLTAGIEVANDFMNVLSELKKASVAANRVKLILDFTDKEIIEFGSSNNNDILGEIDFRNVSYAGDKYNPKLKNISFSIKENEMILFCGQKNCGKRTIFNLLRRNIKQTSGDIYLDKVDIFDYSEKIHKHNVNYLTTKPYFFHGTILKNLRLVESDFKRIGKICKELDLLHYINNLPKRFQTDVNELPDGKKYLLQLARTLLTYSEVIILYEFPAALSLKEKELVIDTLEKIKGTRTILIFSAVDTCKRICDKTIKIERGLVEVIKNKKKKV